MPARAALEVRLPPQLHVQSNAPRDPALIPTELTFNPPAGIRVTELVFPKATDFQQAGLPQPLAVFEHEFAIGIQFAVAEGRRPPSRFPDAFGIRPATTRCAFHRRLPKSVGRSPCVGPATKTTRTRPDVFERIAFGTGAAPSTAAAPSPHRDVSGRKRRS